jgi:hypothetical protein
VGSGHRTAEVSGSQVITLVIAVLGLLLAVAGLVWQAATWRLAGPVVKVELGEGTVLPTGLKYVSVTARNVGRSDVSITGWGLQQRGDSDVMMIPMPTIPTPTPPVTLAAGHSLDFYFERPALEAHFPMLGSIEVRGFIGLATGKRLYSKDHRNVALGRGNP